MTIRDPSGATYFEGPVYLNDRFDVIPDSTFATDVQVTIRRPEASYDDVLQTFTFHASCSRPLLIGDHYGALELIDVIPKGPVRYEKQISGKKTTVTN